ncbi:MAG: fasciclin domain-containing protein [Tannerella sp.]|jgi:uncharacterized surface protein with fasciclin (FAS1) repeats|nr:fasciclin domain-containing protein [Tannerella sp.]
MNKTLSVMLHLFTLAGLTAFLSCEDEYIYDNGEPDFLGASIYEELEKDGHFTYFLKLIDELNYKEVLLYTGSKTLFPARDDAFDRFFATNNPYGASKYENLSHAQKREIMNTSMVNMAYLTYMLSNTPSGDAENPGLNEGLAIRRIAANSCLDSVGFTADDALFQANSYWAPYRNRGLYLLENEQSPRIVHFTPANRTMHGITDEDFAVLFNGQTLNAGDIHVNGVKVIKKDIICKNGYIHVVEDVLTPVKNMAQIIRDNGETNLFSSLLNKFSMPVYSEESARSVHNYYNGATPDRPLIPESDSIFIKRYFNDADFNADPTGNTLTNYGLLYYDPTDHAYNGGSNQDMGATFVPTDQALNDYFNSEKGRYLKDIYGTWDNVPTSLLALFLKNHQKKSFLSALPHEWATMNDESSFYMNVKKEDIRKTYVTGNGAVYVTEAVYPPVDFQSVFASVMTAPETEIMNWGIRHNNMKFFMYLRSIENMYNLLIPADDAFDNYRDPISWARGTNPEIWSFNYVPETDMVYAKVYRADENGNKGELLRELRNTEQAIILNRINDIIDMHIVVGQKEKATGAMSGYIDDGQTRYARTKSGATLKISNGGDQLQIAGGGDIETGSLPAEITANKTGKKNAFPSENGKTWFIDKILHDPTKSVYTLMREHDEYRAFMELLLGDEQVFTFFQNDKDILPIFDYKKVGATSGIGFVVNSFNNFRYTVFVPTEDALARAFADDPRLHPWSEIADETDYDRKKEMTLYLLEFLKFHFMDNSVFIDGKSFSGISYETAARNERGKFRKVTINSNGENLNIYGENRSPETAAQVIKTDGLYNRMTRDYIVNNSNYMNATQIVSSSRAVIHLIDKALKYE